MDIRSEAPADTLPLYRAAFGEEDLSVLVGALIAEPDAVPLAAFDDGVLIGHGFMTRCRVGDGPSGEVALLGPLAVAPDRQRSGVGGALIRFGVEQMRAAGARVVLVLGDPAYYGRLGFAPETAVRSPYAIPDEWASAWRSLPLGSGPLPSGVLAPPPPWRDRALWAP